MFIINSHKFKPIEGKYINLREAEVDDSLFILQLRTDPKKAKYIHATSPNIEHQRQFMQTYKNKDDEWYFIIENKKHESLGTYSVYRYPILCEEWQCSENKKKGLLGFGRWLVIDSASPLESLESDLLIKKFFFQKLNLKIAPLMIHKNNKTILNFQQKWGSKIFSYNSEIEHYLLNLSFEDYMKNKSIFERFVYR